ncbi:hypothetical protein ALC53_05323 [Atta colombica]|uniref:Uncharacterized protein n=1 Tax=Atta colombica TaxID=520822 RepID=A0A195BJB5_9HYME|nr:hypothetical protein ALC53_05323 [Atta colombica]
MPPHYTAHYAMTLFTNKRMAADAIENKEQRSGTSGKTIPEQIVIRRETAIVDSPVIADMICMNNRVLSQIQITLTIQLILLAYLHAERSTCVSRGICSRHVPVETNVARRSFSRAHGEN